MRSVQDPEALILRHQAPLQWHLRYLGCPHPDIPDLVQETFLRLFRARFEHRSHRSTAAWLRKTARNLYIRSVERRNRTPLLADLDAAEATWARFEQDDGGDGWLDALRHCVGRLKDRARRALDLQFRDGLPRQQVAAQLGLSDQGAKTLLGRAKKALKDCVERRLLA
ncbi:MAG: RNA polymerase sigma factor [Planctomycetota bacterium]